MGILLQSITLLLVFVTWRERPIRCPSWNDGPAKQAIVEFVQATTDARQPELRAAAERIATFDQDGTLWVEHPMYAQVIYASTGCPAVVKAKPGAGRRSSRSRRCSPATARRSRSSR